MYVILNEECTHVFWGLSPNMRPQWRSIDELSKEKEGFQLAIFKDTAPTIKLLEGMGINAIEHRAIKLFDELT